MFGPNPCHHLGHDARHTEAAIGCNPESCLILGDSRTASLRKTAEEMLPEIGRRCLFTLVDAEIQGG